MVYPVLLKLFPNKGLGQAPSVSNFTYSGSDLSIPYDTVNKRKICMSTK